jgi:hypothetical protein
VPGTDVFEAISGSGASKDRPPKSEPTFFLIDFGLSAADLEMGVGAAPIPAKPYVDSKVPKAAK